MLPKNSKIWKVEIDQIQALKPSLNLLQDDAKSFNLSEAQRFSRARALTFLIHIFNCFGAEVILLCSTATSVTLLARTNLEDVVLQIGYWWESFAQSSSWADGQSHRSL
jgi:hypothetical protein